MLHAFLKLNIHCRVSVIYARRLEKYCRRLEKYCRRLEKYCRRWEGRAFCYTKRCRWVQENVGGIHGIIRCCIANCLPPCMYACVLWKSMRRMVTITTSFGKEMFEEVLAKY